MAALPTVGTLVALLIVGTLAALLIVGTFDANIKEMTGSAQSLFSMVTCTV